MTADSRIRFAPAVQSMVEFIEPYRPWIEQRLGAPFSDTMTFELETSLIDVVVGQFLEDVELSRSRLSSSHSNLVTSWVLPPSVSPRIALARLRDPNSPAVTRKHIWSADWKECPVAIQLAGVESEVVAVNVPYVSFCQGLSSGWCNWLIVNRRDATNVLHALEDVVSDPANYLMVFGGRPMSLRRARYDWDSLVLDPAVTRLVRSDFERFFEREQWFRDNGLPFRRGYLFYGPPGNGKTSVIRVMASHPAITAHTVNLNSEHVDDDALSSLFSLAFDTAPSLIILEDIDRVFGQKEKEEHAKVSMQHVLNCLDGVVVNDGIIVVGTANNPAVLDSAILKRPGRFDRVVAFRNPNFDLRLAYLQKVAARLPAADLRKVASESDGFSFAQLRETFILGAQLAFEQDREVLAGDLEHAVRTIQSQYQSVKLCEPGAAVGFRSWADPSSTEPERPSALQSA